uniref:Uncharacterized protein n=1 Tax=Solanum lycopersicum TaxID=4081 RepID=K4AUK7_SOLLC
MLYLSVMQSNFIRVSILRLLFLRCTRIKLLVMPAWDKLETKTICIFFMNGKILNLMMHSIEEPSYHIKKI